MRTSQKRNILRHLLYGPLCGQEKDWTLGNRIPARIHELRGKGFPIEKHKCDQRHNHQSYQVEFYIPYQTTEDYKNWCADCGRPHFLRFSDDPVIRRGGKFWLPVACHKCGKGDWR